MAATPPEELKFVNAYLQRAHELQTKEPIVAYYCKYYAAKLAINKGGKSKEGQTFLIKLMDELEKDKKALGDNEAITNDLVGYAHVENFALRIFMNADNEDREGMASKKTAKTFLAASIFLELLKVFNGEVDPQVQDKIRYAKFKAADIIKALREGRTPTPGTGHQEEQPGLSSSGPSQASLTDAQPAPPSDVHPDFGTPYDPSFDPSQYRPPLHTSIEPNSYHPPGSPYANLYPQQQPQYIPPTTTPPNGPASVNTPAPQPTQPRPHAPTATSPARSASSQAAYELNYKSVQAAQKHSRFAISALQYDDIPTAIDNLQKALALLQPLRKT